ncbi:Cytidine deaminase [Cladophialophora carrionii]|uniref:Cytidine deaminase n=1 Tax=Cladophialophora carrionii TaxID=86049 RepID=A0A1C1CK33_9EURO|nr:Cytidine deaminase [Cladophialophora carrionii]
MADKALVPLSDEEVGKLATLAIESKSKAYCPYSNFRVGASVLLSNGTYHTGANVEVASTPVGICAERCAIAPIIASVSRPEMPILRALAVATDISPPASPCGMCRQFINEFASSRQLPIYMYGKEGLQGKPVKMTIGELLPMSFGPNDMEKNPGSVPGKDPTL